MAAHLALDAVEDAVLDAVDERLDAVPPQFLKVPLLVERVPQHLHDRGHTYLPAHLLHTLDDVVAGVIHVA